MCHYLTDISTALPLPLPVRAGRITPLSLYRLYRNPSIAQPTFSLTKEPINLKAPLCLDVLFWRVDLSTQDVIFQRHVVHRNVYLL